ncbi:hypothetical protein PhCBS80983_g04084 [Powellomyces hirtus]|uniref:[histone H3]-trimethyl-L-lysine(9) demethylase n=1 Tax=Powellomyces hirtus TaxID=109895 RepID=A0A507DZ10_9FUNG|nr:hypothetical protein PhCBS80983_g04084 [Powellomyces hirtus]
MASACSPEMAAVTEPLPFHHNDMHSRQHSQAPTPHHQPQHDTNSSQQHQHAHSTPYLVNSPPTTTTSTTTTASYEDCHAASHAEPLTAPPTPAPASQHSLKPPPPPTLTIEPDHYYEPNGVPVFTPTLEQFENFADFMRAIDAYGKAAGIVKVIPPREWTQRLPDITPVLSTVKIRKPIVQEITGGGLPNGAYFQMNIEQRRVYSVQDWHDLANSVTHKPPVFDSNGKALFEALHPRKRVRKNKSTNEAASQNMESNNGATESPVKENNCRLGEEAAAVGENGVTPMEGVTHKTDDAHVSMEEEEDGHEEMPGSSATEPPGCRTTKDTTHATVDKQPAADRMDMKEEHMDVTAEASSTVALAEGMNEDAHVSSGAPDETPGGAAILPSRPTETQSTDLVAPQAPTPSPKTSRKRLPAHDTPVTFKPSTTGDGFTDSYCQDLERYYWKNITYVSPMYGADMLGSLFDGVKEQELKDGNSWNLARLDNLLRRVNVFLPGVNSPYLYFGMWKATFAWHVEDMDLYSINYIHFGAPKQWYVIPPESRARFENVAKGVFANEATKCPEFLRHKTNILSPKYLAAKHIPVNRVIQRAGEFVITFPYGYHQGFNLGFNCAESVNFALDSWVEIGKKAGYCQCVGDSVKLDVAGIFDPPVVKKIKLVLGAGPDVPSAPGGKRKRERNEDEDGEGNVGDSSPTRLEPPHQSDPGQPRAKIRKPRPPRDPTAPPKPPRRKALLPPEKAADRRMSATPLVHISVNKCILCLSPDAPLLPTDKSNVYAHRLCALFVPETRVEPHPLDPATEMVTGVDEIDKARWRLKCAICKPKLGKGKLGACIQCAKGKCVRAYHVWCAQNSGSVTMVKDAEVPHCFCPQHDPGKEVAKRTERRQWLSQAEELFAPGMVVWARVETAWFEGVIQTVFRDRQACRIVFYDGYSRTVAWSATRTAEAYSEQRERLQQQERERLASQNPIRRGGKDGGERLWGEGGGGVAEYAPSVNQRPRPHYPEQPQQQQHHHQQQQQQYQPQLPGPASLLLLPKSPPHPQPHFPQSQANYGLHPLLGIATDPHSTSSPRPPPPPPLPYFPPSHPPYDRLYPLVGMAPEHTNPPHHSPYYHTHYRNENSMSTATSQPYYHPAYPQL